MSIFSFIFNLGNFYHSFTKFTNFWTKQTFNLFLCHITIFYHIMQQTCLDSLQIRFHIHEKFCRSQRMDNIRLTRKPDLILVLFCSILISGINSCYLLFGKIFFGFLDNLLQQFLRIVIQWFIIKKLFQSFYIHTIMTTILNNFKYINYSNLEYFVLNTRYLLKVQSLWLKAVL